MSQTQAHEASLQWRVGLLSSTAFRAGAALVPFRGAVLQVLAALAEAPSQVGVGAFVAWLGRVEVECGV